MTTQHKVASFNTALERQLRARLRNGKLVPLEFSETLDRVLSRGTKELQRAVNAPRLRALFGVLPKDDFGNADFEDFRSAMKAQALEAAFQGPRAEGDPGDFQNPADKYKTVRVVGTAELVRDVSDGKEYVSKRMTDRFLNEDEWKAVEKELSVWAFPDHPNVLGYADIYESKGRLQVVMEGAAGRQLSDRIATQREKTTGRRNPQPQRLGEAQVMGWFLQMAEGLQHLHAHGCLHRDLKPANILVSGDDVVKIADFGLTRVVEHGQKAVAGGTSYYLAPELCEGGAYDQKVDAWALGCVLAEMCILHYAFPGATFVDVVRTIAERPPRPIPETYSPDLRGLVDRMLEKDPGARAGVADVLAMEYPQRVRAERDAPPVLEELVLEVVAPELLADGEETPGDSASGVLPLPLPTVSAGSSPSGTAATTPTAPALSASHPPPSRPKPDAGRPRSDRRHSDGGRPKSDDGPGRLQSRSASMQLPATANHSPRRPLGRRATVPNIMAPSLSGGPGAAGTGRKSPAKPGAQSPGKPVAQSPAKPVAQSPSNPRPRRPSAKLQAQSPPLAHRRHSTDGVSMTGSGDVPQAWSKLPPLASHGTKP